MTTRRKVALYHPWIYLRGGIERCLVELVNRSRHDWTIFTSHFRPHDTFPEFRDFDVRCLSDVSVDRSVVSVATACFKLIVRDPGIRGYDALMISSEGVGNLLALRAGGIPLLCLCHTPLKVAYDPHHRARWLRLNRPGWFTKAGVSLFAAIDRLTWPRYQKIFCTGAEVKRRLLDARLASEAQIAITHPGVDTDVLKPTGRREPYFLWLGRIKWWKNPDLALNAFEEYRKIGNGRFELVVAGAVDDASRSYFRALRKKYDAPDVKFVCPASDAEVHDLIDRSTAVLSTTPNEDWGIVPLEAMAFGKPVISVNRGGPTETVLNGRTGFLCDESPTAFARAMHSISTESDGYVAMSAAARERSLQFHWRQFVRPIDDYIDGLPAGSGRAI
jgi:glycosyltransferase involved in cell wall biosynthesis